LCYNLHGRTEFDAVYCNRSGYMTQDDALAAAFPSLAPLRPRSMLFTLYGDYAYPLGRAIGLRSLVAIAERLGIGDAAVRSAVARLARQDWLEPRKSSGRSSYGLTEAGRQLIDEGTRRIYTPRLGPWDGAWCLLTYSIPEARRAARDRLRRNLAWLGFGALGSGTYVSPRDVAHDARLLVHRHGADRFSRIFSARFAGPGVDADIVRQCWDLAAIGRRYVAFCKHYEPMHARDVRNARARGVPDAIAFTTRFALTHDFRRFPFIDPDLPRELLPEDWPGLRARTLFEKYHGVLTKGALRFFDAATDGV
jgi:phenylacetic acid degradation operon negative regulatory protein